MNTQKNKQKAKYGVGIWILCVLLVIVGVIFIYPYFYLICNSLKTAVNYYKNDFALPSSPLAWDTYRTMIKGFKIFRYFKNTAIIAVISEIIVIPISVCTAYTFAKIRFKGLNGVYLLMVAAMTIPAQVTAIPIYIYFGKLGLNNTYWALILWNLTMICGCTVMMTSFFKTIPNELIDAARVDGCGYFGTIWNVIVPVGKPIIVIQIILNLTTIWNELFMSKILLQKASVKTVMVALSELNDKYAQKPTHTFAGMALAALPTILLFLIFQKHIIKDAAGGAVKG